VKSEILKLATIDEAYETTEYKPESKGGGKYLKKLFVG